MIKSNQKIPEGWSVKKLGNIIDTFSGGTPLVGESIYYENGTIPFIRSGEIYQNYTELYITEKGLEESSAKMVKKGDLLFALYGANSGEVAISQINGAINQAILCIRPKYDNVNYLNNVFVLVKDKILHKYLQGGQGNLSAEIVKSLNFVFPPLPEQEKIAEILETWDEAIEKLPGLIEQKKLLKKGLMQKLLTGKTRLPGFTQPWKEVKLSDFLKEHTEKTTENDQYQVLSVTKNGICSQEEYFEKQIASENNIGYKILRKHDIVFSPMNLWMGSIGFSEYDIGIVSPAYKIFTVNENVALFSFLKHFMIINRMIYLYLINSEQGASIVRRNLDLDGLLSSKVSIPDIAEQQAIADVLSTADDEISLLNQKLEALKEQKKSLMQQLLTGQIRVKVN